MYASILDARGIYSYANNLGTQAPPGSASYAMNVNADQIGNYTTRRGFQYYSNQKFTVTGGFITKLFVYENILFASFNGGQFAQDNGSGTWTTYGGGFLMLPPSGGNLHQMLAGGNSYFTTSNGVYKLSGINSTAPTPAGAPPALDTVVTVGSMISSGFLNAQSQCAYSIVWGYTDESDLQIIGTPSNPAYASNTQSAGASNNANTSVVFSIPPFVSQSQSLPWFYQIYRTPNTGSLTVPPGNNYQQVTQGNPASADYTNHYITFADTVLDSLVLLGADLYTDDGQPNVGNPYGLPPLAQEIAYFNNMAFYANYSTLQDVFLTLDAVGATAGIQSGDTITITDSTSATSYVYTAGSSNVPATRHFAVYTSGTPSVNIQTTAQNLVSVINQDPNNALFTVQYVSGYSSLPGQMEIFAQNLSQAFFSVVSSRTTCWTPALPSSGTTYASSNVTVQNGLQVSVLGQPESCPPDFLEPVGSKNFPIERMVPCRAGLIAVKPEEGCFIITGTSPSALTVTPLDTTAFIKGSETMAALNNSGYFFTTQGVMLVNESGCEIMSRNIQGDILALASSNYPNFSSLAFGLGYQSDNAYILFCQASPTDPYSTIQYRYNWITQAWTTWDKPCTAAVINTANDCMYIATPQGYILEERKTFSNQDYADETNAITITSIGTLSFTLASSANVNVGDQISQTSGPTTYTCVVTANNTVTNVVSVSTVVGFVNGSANDTASINSTVTYMPVSGGYPAFVKKFNVFNFEFAAISFNEATVSFTTNFYPNAESVTLVPKVSNTWGTFAWGTVEWGVNNPSLQAISTYSTKNCSIGNWIVPTVNLQQAFSGFSLSGFVASFDFLGNRFR
jgi:hypothetical protein